MKEIWITLLFVWVLFTCKSRESKNVESKDKIILESKNMADSVELAYMDSVEKAEAILNAGRSFECGINTYWTRNKLKRWVLDSLDPNLISYNEHYDSLHINGNPSVLVTDSIAKDYLFDVSQDFTLYQLTIGKFTYYILKSKYAGATKAYTLYYVYLVIDSLRGKSYTFQTIATPQNTFFLTDAYRLQWVTFTFAEEFYEKGLFSLVANTDYPGKKNKYTQKQVFLDCICK